MMDILLLNANPDEYPAYMASRVRKLLEKQGIIVSSHHLSEGGIQKYLSHARPERLITFEEHLTDHFPLPKILRCSELCIPKKATSSLFSLENSQKKIAVSDRNLAECIKGEFFVLPLDEPFVSPQKTRTIPLASFTNLIDPTYLERLWQRLFPDELYHWFLYSATLFLQRKEIHPYQQILSLTDLHTFSREKLYEPIMQYIDAARSKALIKACRALPLHLFGNHCGQDWYLTLSKTIHLHRLPPFVPTLALLEEVEILIIDQLESVDGLSEYFFHALQKGALPLIPPSPYLVELYGREAAIFYHSYEELVTLCQVFLHNPSLRYALVEKIRDQSKAIFAKISNF